MSLFSAPVGAIEPDALNASLIALLESRGERMDKRGLADARPTSVHVAMQPLPVVTVSQGGSMVVVGIKAELGPCDVAAPGRGRLSVEATTPLMGSSVANEQQLEGRRCLSAFVLDVLGLCADSRSWCIREGEACWQLFVDIVVLSTDGGLRDVAAHGARIALSKLRLPRTMLPDGTFAEATAPRMLSHPYCLTFGAVSASSGSSSSAVTLLADPTAAEENAASGLTTVVVDASNPSNILRIVHHGGIAIAPVSIVAAVVAASKNISKDESACLRP